MKVQKNNKKDKKLRKIYQFIRGMFQKWELQYLNKHRTTSRQGKTLSYFRISEKHSYINIKTDQFPFH
jgi:hypothetical protein